MTAPLDLDDLRQGLLDKLRVVLHIHEPEADSNKDSFIVDAHKYVLKATISEAEVSYTFELKQPINVENSRPLQHRHRRPHLYA